MKQNEYIPTGFAKSLARSFGLLNDHNDNEIEYSVYVYADEIERLRVFQQMSMGCSFEEALIAYHGVDLNEDQMNALQVIHKSTAPWLIGHVVSELLDDVKIDKGKAASLILNELIKDGQVDPEVGKDFVVKLQVMNAKEKKDE